MIYGYALKTLHAECACPQGEFTGKRRKRLISRTFIYGNLGNFLGIVRVPQMCVSQFTFVQDGSRT